MAGAFRWPLGMGLVVLGALLFAGSFLPDSASAAASATPTVKVAQDAKLGTILTDSQGMALYTFKKDKPGESAYVDARAKRWPPLAVPEGMQPMAAPGIPGKLGQIERKDDTYQATYNGMPLYRYAGDSKAGDTNGQGLGGNWFVVPTTTSHAATSGASSKSW
jgi:predicted lipoprotein with Yx(FWY)xxD motif